MTFVLLEIGRANVGDRRPRRQTSELLREWNDFRLDHNVRVFGAVGLTGNYLAEGDATIEALGEAFRRINIRMAVFHAADFIAWSAAALNFLSRLPEDVPRGRRATRGLVMDLNPCGGIPEAPPSSERVRFASFAVPRVRGLWKLDVLTEDGRRLEGKKREGGWGRIATVMKQHAEGEWTARSLRTIIRLASRLRGGTIA